MEKNMTTHLLKYLVENNTEVKMEYLLEALNVSVKQLSELIKYINEKYYNIFKIRNIDSNLRIDLYNYKEFIDLFQGDTTDVNLDLNFIDNRLMYILNKLISADDYILISDLENELFVSRSTINNDLADLRLLLDDYNIEIKGKPNRGIRLIGSELNIRTVILKHIKDLYIHNYLESNNNLDSIITKKEEEYSLNLQKSNLLRDSIIITIHRINENKNLGTLPSKINNPIYDFEISNYIINEVRIKNKYPTEQDLTFASHALYTTLFNLDLEQPIIESTVITEIFTKIINEIEKRILISIDKKHLFKEIKNHLYYMIFRLSFYVDLPDIFTSEIEKQFPLAFELGRISGKIIGQELDREVSKTEIAYLALYFEKIISPQESKGLSVAIVSNLGNVAVELVEKEIINLFGDYVKINKYSEQAFVESSLINNDIIITTFPIHGFKNIPTVNLSDIFNQESLRSHLEILKFKKLSKENKVHFFGFKLDEEAGYLENIKTMGNSLVKENLISKNFVNKIIEKENNHTTIFSNGISMPHEVSECNNLICAIGYFDKAFEHNNLIVNSIFLLIIPKDRSFSEERDLLELYDLIFNLKVGTASDVDYFKNLIKNLKFEDILIKN